MQRRHPIQQPLDEVFFPICQLNSKKCSKFFKHRRLMGSSFKLKLNLFIETGAARCAWDSDGDIRQMYRLAKCATHALLLGGRTDFWSFLSMNDCLHLVVACSEQAQRTAPFRPNRLRQGDFLSSTIRGCPLFPRRAYLSSSPIIPMNSRRLRSSALARAPKTDRVGCRFLVSSKDM